VECGRTTFFLALIEGALDGGFRVNQSSESFGFVCVQQCFLFVLQLLNERAVGKEASVFPTWRVALDPIDRMPVLSAKKECL
jgi:hypothetical protein